MFSFSFDGSVTPRELRAVAQLVQVLLGESDTKSTLPVPTQLWGDPPPPIPTPAVVVGQQPHWTGAPSVPTHIGEGWAGGTVETGGAAAPVPLAPPAPSIAAAPVSPTAPVAPPAPGAPGLDVSYLNVPSFAQQGAAPVGAPTQNPAGSVELDNAGLPWDTRIHSSSKVKLANGLWKKKKALNDAAFIGRIETELRNLMAQPVPAGMTIVAPPAPVPMAPPAPVPMAPPAPVPMAPSPAMPGAAPRTYEELVPALTGRLRDAPALTAKLGPTLQALGVPQIPGLAQRPDLIPAFWAMLNA